MVAITFRTDDLGQWGSGKGGNLTPSEVDQNFYNLKTEVEAMGVGPAPAEIDTITLTGNQLLITLDDAREFGPYTLPRASLRWRGDWAAATAYVANDIVRVAGLGLYLVNYAHTSESTFDAGYIASGESEAAYIQMFAIGSDVTAEAGATLTPAATAPQQYYRLTGAGGCAVTIPPEADEAFPIGAELSFVRRDGAVSVAAGTGVTLNVPTGFTANAAYVGAVITAKKAASDEWDLFGDLATV